MLKGRILDRLKKLEEAVEEPQEIVFKVVFSDGRQEIDGPTYVCRLPGKRRAGDEE